jgi:DNA-binding CsgD family transcriptional regulator
MVATTGFGGVVPRGRDVECAQLDELLEGALNGRSGVLVLTGDAGVGKTALLEYAIASGSALRVVRVAGREAELELAFAGLHQLCAPMLDGLERLPEPQRDALRTTFGLSAGAVPDRFLIGLAVLSLLSDVAGEQPLLCAIDDVQWLDRATAQTLAFVAGRMLAEPVALLLAGRVLSDVLVGLPELQLQGLADADARALLASAVPGPLDEQVAERIVAETRGNPLALLELPRGLSPAQLAGGFGLPGAISLSGRIEESFLKRQETLPEDTERLLLLAAAEPAGDPEVLKRAAERLGMDDCALEPAEAAGLIEVRDGVRFRHPLVRSAIYGAATPRQRRDVHHVLAEATDDHDPDRRAWHLAEAAFRLDERVAAELEHAAARAQARGGFAAAAAFLERAVALTPEPGRQAERALAAAQAHLQGGAAEAAVRLLARAEAGPLDDELGRAHVERLRGQIEFASSAGSEAPALLLKAAKRIESLDVMLARETYLDAWVAALFAGGCAPAGTLREVSRAARSAPQPTSAPRAADILLDAFAVLVTEGRSAAAPMLRRAVSAIAQGEITATEGLRWGWLAAHAAWTLWDDQSWRQAVGRQLQTVREAGLLDNLPVYLQTVGANAAWRGDFAIARSLIAEGDTIAEATGSGLLRYAAVVLGCFRGREAEARTLIEVEREKAAAAGQGYGIQLCQLLSAMLNIALGRYGEALAQAQQASEHAPELCTSGWALAELIEAAARTGNTRAAGEALERLAEATNVGENDWGFGVLARSRALLLAGEAAERSYREAIERLSRIQFRTELARAHLVYGEWLRRERRRRDARQQLGTALEMFTSMGTEAFAARTERELLATGESFRKRSVETWDNLTPQEVQIARLASEGLSNPEIGARLFISQTTVAYHLQHVFSKLNIASRHQLDQALPDSARV